MYENISDKELVELYNKNKIFDIFNMTVLEVDTTKGTIKMEFNITEKFCNPTGDVQGGIVSGMQMMHLLLHLYFKTILKRGHQL